jgi:hypothetical protein
LIPLEFHWRVNTAATRGDPRTSRD